MRILQVLLALAALALLGNVTGADADAESAAAAARKSVDFLLKQQNDDGTFGKSRAKGLPGMSGLVVKALVQSPDKLLEANSPAVAKAVKYILTKQLPSGAIADPNFGQENYNTSIAAVALASLENPAYHDVLEKAKKYILSCQLTEERSYDKDEHKIGYGGFGYGDTKRSDVSNTGFSLEALKALGVKEDSPAWKNAVIFLKRSQDNSETNDLPQMKDSNDSGGFTYLPGQSEFGTYTTRTGKKLPKPYGSMTYQAVKSLIYAGVSKDDPCMQAAFKWIKNNYSVKENPGGDGSQGYFYYVLVFAKAFTAAGVKDLELADGRKADWAKDLATHLISLQKADGSFVNPDPHWMENDGVLSTAYALDALNLCTAALKK